MSEIPKGILERELWAMASYALSIRMSALRLLRELSSPPFSTVSKESRRMIEKLLRELELEDGQ